MKFNWKLWKDLTFKIWFYDWDFDNIAEFVKEKNKEKEFFQLTLLLYKAKNALSSLSFSEKLSKKEISILAEHPFLWHLAKLLEEKKVFKKLFNPLPF